MSRLARAAAAARSSCDATAPDVNHAQILGDDSIALVSERNWNGIAKVHDRSRD